MNRASLRYLKAFIDLDAVTLNFTSVWNDILLGSQRTVQLFAYVNHARIRTWNQPVLSNESNVSCSRKQRGPLMVPELKGRRCFLEMFYFIKKVHMNCITYSKIDLYQETIFILILVRCSLTCVYHVVPRACQSRAI